MRYVIHSIAFIVVFLAMLVVLVIAAACGIPGPDVGLNPHYMASYKFWTSLAEVVMWPASLLPASFGPGARDFIALGISAATVVGGISLLAHFVHFAYRRAWRSHSRA